MEAGLEAFFKGRHRLAKALIYQFINAINVLETLISCLPAKTSA
jgi:hypothetical protein